MNDGTSLAMGNDTSDQRESPQQERRAHPRLNLRLPVECWVEDGLDRGVTRGVSHNVSAVGLYFEARVDAVRPGMALRIDFSVPPGHHFPYQGRVTGRGTVVRVKRLDDDPHRDPARGRFGIAARFVRRLELDFG